MRIFVDVDETLKLTNLDGTERPNLELIEALRLMNGAAPIIVWTNVGKQRNSKGDTPNKYAAAAAEDYLTAYGVHSIGAIDKDFELLREGDIAIDDLPISGYASDWMTAEDFIGFAAEWRKSWDASHKHAVLGGCH